MKNWPRIVQKMVLQWICFSFPMHTLMQQPLDQQQLSQEDKSTDIPILRLRILMSVISILVYNNVSSRATMFRLYCTQIYKSPYSMLLSLLIFRQQYLRYILQKDLLTMSCRFHKIVNTQTTSLPLTTIGTASCQDQIDSDFRLEILAQIPSGTQLFLSSLQ